MPTVDISQDFSTPATGGASAYGFEDIDVTTGGGGPHFNLRPLVVSGGIARATAVGFDTIVRHTTDMQSPDHWAEADVVIGPAVTGQYTGVSVRMSGTPKVWTWYKLEVWGQPDRVRIICLVDRVTRGEWYAPQTISPNTTYTLRLEAVGNRIRGWVNGVLKFDFIDNNIPGNTRAGMHVVPDTGAIENSGITAWRAQNFLTTPTTTTPSGEFRVVAGNIIDPNGRPFIPWGGGTVSRPVGIDPNDGFWGTAANRYSYGNGNAFRAVADGWNATEVMVPIPDPLAPFTMAQSLEGLGEMLDEWTAAGIVCIVYPWWAQGYDPVNYASAPTEVRAVQTYLCENYADNPYVWLETMGEAWQFIWDQSDPNWTRWSTTSTECYNDAIARGWTGMQVFVLGQYGQGIGRMQLTTMYDEWYDARNSNKVVFGWHNFGSLPTVAQMRAAVVAVKGRGLPIICTSFGQNWNDGTVGFGGIDEIGDAVGVDFTAAHGNELDVRTGGIAWQATGPHTVVSTTATASPTGNVYSFRYNFTSGRFRPWYDTGEALNEVGRLIRDRAALGYATIGGGPSTGVAPPPPPVVNPPVVVAPTARLRQTRGRLTIGGAGGTVYGGRPRP